MLGQGFSFLPSNNLGIQRFWSNSINDQIKELITNWSVEQPRWLDNILFQLVFAPILWAQNTLKKAKCDGLLPSDILYHVIHKYITKTFIFFILIIFFLVT